MRPSAGHGVVSWPEGRDRLCLLCGCAAVLGGGYDRAPFEAQAHPFGQKAGFGLSGLDLGHKLAATVGSGIDDDTVGDKRVAAMAGEEGFEPFGHAQVTVPRGLRRRVVFIRIAVGIAVGVQIDAQIGAQIAQHQFQRLRDGGGQIRRSERLIPCRGQVAAKKAAQNLGGVDGEAACAVGTGGGKGEIEVTVMIAAGGGLRHGGSLSFTGKDCAKGASAQPARRLHGAALGAGASRLRAASLRRSGNT